MLKSGILNFFVLYVQSMNITKGDWRRRLTAVIGVIYNAISWFFSSRRSWYVIVKSVILKLVTKPLHFRTTTKLLLTVLSNSVVNVIPGQPFDSGAIFFLNFWKNLHRCDSRIIQCYNTALSFLNDIVPVSWMCRGRKQFMIMFIVVVVLTTSNFPRTRRVRPTNDKLSRAASHLGACVVAPGSRKAKISLWPEASSFAAAEDDVVVILWPLFDEVVAKGQDDGVKGSPGFVNGLEFEAK